MVFNNCIKIISETIDSQAPIKRLSRKETKFQKKTWITFAVLKSKAKTKAI